MPSGDAMLAAADAGQSVVAAILGLGTVGLAGGVVAMVWSLQTGQGQRVGRLGRRQAGQPAGQALPAPGANGTAVGANGVNGVNGAMPAPGTDGALTAAGMNGDGGPDTIRYANGMYRPPGSTPREVRPDQARPAQVHTVETRAAEGRGGAAEARGGRTQAQAARGSRSGPAAPCVIEGPDSVVTGEEARYRVRRSGAQQVVAWAAGGGAVSQASDPAHPDDLLLVADRPGNLTVSVRLREGLAERRETKSVTVVANPEAAIPAVASRLLVQDWPIVTVAVLVAGFAAALVALGILGASDFIALVAPLTAVLAVVAATRGAAGRQSR